MARKSRKPNRNGKPVSEKVPYILTAGYVRLSVKDMKEKGDSIENQKRIILNYIDAHPELQLYDMYVDDGESGVTFERPAFSRMMDDIDKGKITCIAVKDVTRFGRNMIDAGYYIEKYLPSMDIRFISINDGYDSSQSGIDTGFVLRNLMSEAYSLDIGRKVRAVIHSQMEKGEYVGNRPPFGYVKSLTDCHKLDIDEPAAEIVKQIFYWAAEGTRVPEMVRLLNCLKIMTPSHYWLYRGIIENVNLTGNGRWQTRTVSKILSNEVYTGKLLQGKTRVSNHKQQSVPVDELIKVEDTHQPIISPELYAKVQEILRTGQTVHDKQPHEPHSLNLFSGKIFCAHCGSRLDRKKNHQYYIYRCSTNYTAPGSCVGNSIREGTLIKAVSKLFVEYAESMIGLEAIILRTKQIRHELNQIQMELPDDDAELRDFYERLVIGDITEKQYRELKRMHKEKVEQQAYLLKQILQQKHEQKTVEADWRKLNGGLQKFQESMELTQELIDGLIRRLDVHDDGRIFLEFETRALGYL